MLRSLFKAARSVPFQTFCTVQQKTLQGLTDLQLKTPLVMGHILESRHYPKRTKRSQRGLFHGKQPKTGKQSCFSEKKSIRRWKPNIMKETFKSDILDKKLVLEISSKAKKCIRKYGGFDNYILLTPSKKLDSLMGEYLKYLMMKKLNQPDFQVPYIPKTREITMKKTGMKRHIQKREYLWKPKELRHKDLSHLRVKLPEEMGRAEFEKWKNLVQMNQDNVDLSTDHPLIREVEAKKQKEMKMLEKDSIAAKKMFEDKIKDKKMKLRVKEALAQSISDFDKVIVPKDEKKKKK